jgi:pyridoxal phosphate enzyme (YggS family)
MLGPLQTNKAKSAVEIFDVIQSVDRLKAAERLDRLAHERGKVQRCLIEVKISTEPTKSGVSLQDAGDFVAIVGKFKNIELEGFMGIGPWGASVQETRQAFRSLKDVFEKNRRHFGARAVLSMGMSDDFELAIEEGSTCVRIGRALFGERSRG